ncbi:MAG: RNA methyltransferase [Clostridia bacterium]|nr:RNA methyltransferase [Clostridia bacterium]
MARILEIKDFLDPRLDVYARLNERQLLNRDKPEEGMFIAESPKVIDRALDAGCVPLTLLLEPAHIEGEAKGIIERCGDVPVFTAPMNVLEQITGYKLTRGVLCCMRRPPLRTAAEVCENATRVAVLEDVMNPTNVGAIFRCAAALGMDAVLLTKASSDPLYRRSVRVSMGTVFQVPWTFLGDEGISELKSLGFTTVAMALENDTLGIRDERLKAEKKLAVVLGTEGEGIKRTTLEKCDYTVCIPMHNGVDSLNVASAAAVAFFQLGNND